jgi:hypothetical protein
VTLLGCAKTLKCLSAHDYEWVLDRVDVGMSASHMCAVFGPAEEKQQKLAELKTGMEEAESLVQ